MKKSLFIILLLVSYLANAQNVWTQKANFGGTPSWGAVGFSIGNKGYIGTGDFSTGYSQQLWEYDPLTDSWTQKANYGGGPIGGAVGFAIGNKGYIGTGYSSDDFWEYDPVSNTWTQKADFGGGPRDYAVGFSIGSKGYIGTGGYLSGSSDFWEYDPITDSWTMKANVGGAARFLATGFSIGNKGYLGAGINGTADTCYNDFWEYDPAINAWAQKADFFSSMPTDKPVGFSIGSKGYIGTGIDVCSNWAGQPNFAEYDPTTDTWQFIADPLQIWLNGLTAFTIGNKAYIGTGEWYGNLSTNFWAFGPACGAGFTLTADTIPHTYIAENTSFGDMPVNYTWDWGDGNYSIGPTPSHTYSNAGSYTICLTINDAGGCIDTFCYASSLIRLAPNSTTVTVNVINAVTGISNPEIAGDDLTIFPNPATTTCTITAPNFINSTLVIYDITGRALLQQVFNERATINANTLQPGMYVVEVRDKEKRVNEKLIIKN